MHGMDLHVIFSIFFISFHSVICGIFICVFMNGKKQIFTIYMFLVSTNSWLKDVQPCIDCDHHFRMYYDDI